MNQSRFSRSRLRAYEFARVEQFACVGYSLSVKPFAKYVAVIRADDIQSSKDHISRGNNTRDSIKLRRYKNNNSLKVYDEIRVFVLHFRRYTINNKKTTTNFMIFCGSSIIFRSIRRILRLGTYTLSIFAQYEKIDILISSLKYNYII